MKAAVIIPTYNEGLSIAAVLDQLLKTVIPTLSDWTVYVVVVDGNSPDGTAEVVKETQHRYRNLQLIIEGKKEGIGAAYFKGFRYAMSELGVDVVIEFDGDFQHPPDCIRLLLEGIRSGADMVIGSRKIKGGAYPSRWNWKRLMLSKLGGFAVRTLLFFPTRLFTHITDPTTGLRATCVHGFLDCLDMDAAWSRSFGYKLQMLYRLAKMGAKIKEIPLKFGPRVGGESKMSGQTPREVLLIALLLRWRDETTRRFLRFATVGLAGFLINAAVLELLARGKMVTALAGMFSHLGNARLFSFVSEPSSWAAAFAAECAIISNYFLNYYWTFFSRRARETIRFITGFFKFNLTSLGAILLQFAGVGSAVHLIADTRRVRQAALILTVILMIVPYTWLMYNGVIWKHGREKEY